MIDREHELPLTRQAEVLKLSRSSLYHRPRPVSPADLAVMRRIDELHLEHPFAGSRMLRDLLRGEGVAIGRERVATMMKRMGIEAIYRGPNTSEPAPGHKIYPYLLRSVAVVLTERLLDHLEAGGDLHRDRHTPRQHPAAEPVDDRGENVWDYLRQNKLCSTVWDDCEEIIAACTDAWNWLIADPERIRSIGTRDWACVNV